MGNSSRHCKDCKHYGLQDWSPWNYECKLGHDTDDTCSDYEERFTVFGTSTNYCDDCEHYDSWSFVGTPCKKGCEIPESKHACNEFEGK